MRVCQNIRKSANSFNGWSQRLAGMRDYIDFLTKMCIILVPMSLADCYVFQMQ